MLSLVVIKLVSLSVLFCICLLGGIVPLKWKYIRDSPNALGHLNAFSGGVFISMALNHLLPDAQEGFHKQHFPFKVMAFTLAMVGYAFIMAIEKICVDVHGNSTTHLHQEKENNNVEQEEAQARYYSAAETRLNYSNSNASETNFKIGSQDSHDDPYNKISNAINVPCVKTPCVAPDSPLPFSHPSLRKRFQSQASMLPAEGFQDVEESTLSLPKMDSPVMTAQLTKSISFATPLLEESPLRRNRPGSYSTTSLVDVNFSQQQKHVVQFPKITKCEESKEQSGASTLVLMSALSVHAVLEGIALGLQTSTDHVYTLSLGLLAHKWVEAIALATSFIKSKRSVTLSLVCMFIFSMATPIGVAIGIALSMVQNALIESSFTAIAAGTFLYVACNEIVSEEFEEKENRVTKFFALIFGMAIIALLAGLNLE